MTIKELCEERNCTNCPFNDICWDLCQEPISEIDVEVNAKYTKAIIETARILQEDKNND